MKHLVIAAVALAGLVPALTPAAAQHTVTHRTVMHGGPSRAGHMRKVCTTSYRHHQRVRTCRMVRSR